ncbi:beta-glucosidase [Mucilaginibacter gilvus]|uniref:Beta-glucosidase n=1 Tax=Mucilaginibacter gilvus TaxID=2305909 RepID=A0A3S3UUJ8_9SPHI|nr:beta-glucosidase [Mucilaginibacter gilvus]RWY48517.1 beta-glucosidase [Mucilaginibacter gilvus]
MDLSRKQYRFIIIVTTLFYLPVPAFAQSGYKSKTVQKFDVNKIYRQLTMDEKVRLLSGIQANPELSGGLPTLSGSGVAGYSTPIPRLGIPSLSFADGSSGIRISIGKIPDTAKIPYTTQLPSPTLLASSWDTKLMYQAGRLLGNEAKAYGIDIVLAPAINIQRNPLGGRNYEYYSEDPLLTGKLAAAMINGIQENGTGASVKHFAANNQETNRRTINAVIEEQTLREIYLKGFEIAVKESHPQTIMTSYNKLNGVYTSESSYLLNGILRKEWGFKGLVLTDWYSGSDPVKQAEAGNDLLMPGKPGQNELLLKAIERGRLDTNAINRNVKRMLQLIALHQQKAKAAVVYPDLDAHAQFARRAAAESMVLLKNKNHALPAAPQKIALFGVSAYTNNNDLLASTAFNPKYAKTLAQGLIGAGFTYNTGLQKQYIDYVAAQMAIKRQNNVQGFVSNAIPEMELSTALIDQELTNSNLAIISIGRAAIKGTDRKQEDDFNLSDTELNLIKAVSTKAHAQNKKLVVILNIAGVIETATWRDWTDAILLTWQPGLYGGSAVADIVTGAVNPSGKLPVTFPINYSDVPSAESFAASTRIDATESVYSDSSYVGYRYYSAFHKMSAYPFGFGLSYTTFSIKNLRVKRLVSNKKIQVTVNVRNTGAIAGKEVVQLYVAGAGKDSIMVELKAFAKTKFLLPNGEQRIDLMLKASYLSKDNDNALRRDDQRYFTIKVGNALSELKLKAVVTI